MTEAQSLSIQRGAQVGLDVSIFIHKTSSWTQKAITRHGSRWVAQFGLHKAVRMLTGFKIIKSWPRTPQGGRIKTQLYGSCPPFLPPRPHWYLLGHNPGQLSSTDIAVRPPRAKRMFVPSPPSRAAIALVLECCLGLQMLVLVGI